METLGLRLLHRKINWGTKINTHISMLDSRRARRCQTFGFLVWLDYFLLSQSKLLYFLSSLFYVRSSVQMGKKWKPEQKHKGWMLHLLSTGMFQIIVILKGPQCLRNISSLNVAPFFFLLLLDRHAAKCGTPPRPSTSSISHQDSFLVTVKWKRDTTAVVLGLSDESFSACFYCLTL